MIDRDGKLVATMLDIDEYDRMLPELEELESVRANDAARESGHVSLRFDVAVREIEGP